jgi:hypothetical protein
LLSGVGGLLFKGREGGARTGTDPRGVQSQLRSGKGLDGRVRTQAESALGRDLSGVRVHTDEQANRLASQFNARAFTVGQDIAFGQGEYRPGSLIGDALIAHELAHVVQQSQAASGPAEALRMDGAASAFEQEADRAAVGTMLSMWTGKEDGISALPEMVFPRLRTGLRLQGCIRGCNGSSTELANAYSGKIPWTADLARQALNEYNGLSEADKATWVTTHYGTGALNNLLSALNAGDAMAGGSYNATLQSILQRVQRSGAIAQAATLGLASQADMAQAQATFMRARNTAAATAALPTVTTPTSAQVAAQQSGQVSATSIAPQTATLSVADELTWNLDAMTQVATFVTWVNTAHPSLSITAGNFRVDSRAVFDRGQNVIAFSDGGTVVVGRRFAEAVKANPAYVLSTVVHEMRGHEEYGPYGTAGSEYGLELYDQAAALMPGYTQPTGAGRTSEIDAYAYQETEIYALLIEAPYFTPVTTAHSHLSAINFDPVPAISSRIGIIKSQYEPRVAQSLVRGLLLRLRLDPRLTATQLAPFEQGVRNNFTATEAASILR